MPADSKLIALAERVEQLTGPDRETDILIGSAIDLRVDSCPQPFRNLFEICGMAGMLRMAESHHNIWHEALPRYTASLDAAMTLVPKGYWIEIQTGTQKHAPDFEWPVIRIGNQSSIQRLWKGQAKTLPLTIVAAALRARAANQSSKREG